jgi:tetratricopeptide (TPR) repeat protein
LTILEELAAKDPSNNDRQNDVSITRGWLGDALQATGDLAGALREFRACLSIDLALAAKNPSDFPLQRKLLDAHSKVAFVLYAQGEIKGAEAEFREAIDIAKERVQQASGDADWLGRLADLLTQLSSVLLDASDRADALTSSEEALKIRRQLYAAGPTPVFKDELVDALGTTSFYLLFSRRAEEAAERAAEALSLDPSVVWIETNRAHAYLFLGRFDEAKVIYLDNKDKRVPGGRTFAKAVIDDFEMFRKNGIDIPAMHEIETLLSS